MNYPHIHLMINHIPVLLPMFALPVFLYGIIKAKVPLIRLGLLAFVISGVAVWPVYYSGEEAEHVMEEIIPQEYDYIEAHEDDGKWARNVFTVLGLFSLGGLYWSYKKGPAPNSYLYAVAAIALVSIYIVADAANSGGEIRHPEIRDGVQPSTLVQQNDSTANKVEKEKDRDDD